MHVDACISEGSEARYVVNNFGQAMRIRLSQPIYIWIHECIYTEDGFSLGNNGKRRKRARERGEISHSGELRK